MCVCVVGLHAMMDLSEGKLVGFVLLLYPYVSSRDVSPAVQACKSSASLHYSVSLLID